ncbi:MAG TPA: NAD(P)-binding domain-containing protein [Syntrophorhabdaceae bacterium]|nr:NAD(P)-binding domain-containing protein [Syntrophorhabdaceae bacterium]
MNETNYAETLKKKIFQKEAIIGVIGLGYVGLPLVREFLKKDFRVIGFDIDSAKTTAINRGESYIKHIPSDFLVGARSRGLLDATTEFTRLKEADVILICVPTPLGRNREPDLSYVINTAKSIASNLKKGHLIILESTTYPETTEKEVLPILEKTGLVVGTDFFLGYSPEREDPGNTDYSTSKIPKVVS